MTLKRLTSPGHLDDRYRALIIRLRTRREELKLSQRELADRLKVHQQFVSRVELLSRRLDVVEFSDYVAALELDPAKLFASIGR